MAWCFIQLITSWNKVGYTVFLILVPVALWPFSLLTNLKVKVLLTPLQPISFASLFDVSSSPEVTNTPCHIRSCASLIIAKIKMAGLFYSKSFVPTYSSALRLLTLFENKSRVRRDEGYLYWNSRNFYRRDFTGEAMIEIFYCLLRSQ